MRTHRVVVHRGGPALWPEHKPLGEVLKLRETTPTLIWEGTYQGNPTPAGGYTFRRDWWNGAERRFRADDPDLEARVVARVQSWDTAEEVNDGSAWSVGVTADIWTDYRLAVRDVYRERLTFDALPATIESVARRWRGRELLRHVVIEAKSSGKAAYQTLRATAAPELAEVLVAWQPRGSKESRASAASVWCRNGMVLLPEPGPGAEWLLDYEDELFSFPQGKYADQVDASSQLILFCENYLVEGWRARGGR